MNASEAWCRTAAIMMERAPESTESISEILSYFQIIYGKTKKTTSFIWHRRAGLGLVSHRLLLRDDLSPAAGLPHPDARGGPRGSGAHRRDRRGDGVRRQDGVRLVVGSDRTAQTLRGRRLFTRDGRTPPRRARLELGAGPCDPFRGPAGEGNPHSASRRDAGGPRGAGKPGPRLRSAARNGQRRRRRGSS